MDKIKHIHEDSVYNVVTKLIGSRTNKKPRFFRVDSSISRTLKRQKGTSIVEVVVAMVIFAVLIIGSHYHFIYGRSQIALRRNYRAALQLAIQHLEELKAGDYNEIQHGKQQKAFAFGNLVGNCFTEANDVGLYKKVNVKVCWSHMDKEHNVSLDTYIAPKR